MGAYVVRRFLLMLLTLFGISVIIFVLLRVMPGNIVDILYDAAGYVNPREKAKIEAELGLDKPIVVQYAAWIGGLARGDLGYSFVSEQPAIEEIAPRIPVTAKLSMLPTGIAIMNPAMARDRRSAGTRSAIQLAATGAHTASPMPTPSRVTSSMA